MRYRGAGRSWWPIVFVVVVAIAVLAAIYWLYFLPR